MVTPRGINDRPRRGDTLIKHQPVGGETLNPNNTLGSLIEFLGIEWVSCGHQDDDPAPLYRNVRFTPESGHAQPRHRCLLSAIIGHSLFPKVTAICQIAILK
jgi:hypothetical protein